MLFLPEIISQKKYIFFFISSCKVSVMCSWTVIAETFQALFSLKQRPGWKVSSSAGLNHSQLKTKLSNINKNNHSIPPIRHVGPISEWGKSSFRRTMMTSQGWRDTRGFFNESLNTNMKVSTHHLVAQTAPPSLRHHSVLPCLNTWELQVGDEGARHTFLAYLNPPVV